MLTFIKNLLFPKPTAQILSISHYKSATNLKINCNIVYGQKVNIRGVCWNTAGNPTFSSDHTYNGTSYGLYESFISNLRTGTCP